MHPLEGAGRLFILSWLDHDALSPRISYQPLSTSVILSAGDKYSRAVRNAAFPLGSSWNCRSELSKEGFRVYTLKSFVSTKCKQTAPPHPITCLLWPATPTCAPNLVLLTLPLPCAGPSFTLSDSKGKTTPYSPWQGKPSSLQTASLRSQGKILTLKAEESLSSQKMSLSLRQTLPANADKLADK